MTDAQKAQQNYCIKLFREGKGADYMIGLGYDRAAVNGAWVIYSKEAGQ